MLDGTSWRDSPLFGDTRRSTRRKSRGRDTTAAERTLRLPLGNTVRKLCAVDHSLMDSGCSRKVRDGTGCRLRWMGARRAELSPRGLKGFWRD
jgi:hypothetical protein